MHIVEKKLLTFKKVITESELLYKTHNKLYCNGTRLLIMFISQKLIKAKIITQGDYFGKVVFIQRTNMSTSEHEYPFQLTRRQFPLKLAMAMTINKSQGQSFKMLGLYLLEPVFAHGQLYVAFSRISTGPHAIVILLSKNNKNKTTTNVVYKEILD